METEDTSIVENRAEWRCGKCSVSYRIEPANIKLTRNICPECGLIFSHGKSAAIKDRVSMCVTEKDLVCWKNGGEGYDRY